MTQDEARKGIAWRLLQFAEKSASGGDHGDTEDVWEEIESYAAACVAEALQPVQAENKRLAQALHRDQTGLALALQTVGNLAKSYRWLENSRGPYAWDDDEYKEEAGRCLRAVVAEADRALRASGNLVVEALRERKG